MGRSSDQVRQEIYRRRSAMKYRDRLAEMEEEGMPIREQAQRLKLAYGTVCSYRATLGLGMRVGSRRSEMYWSSPETKGGRLAAALPKDELAGMLRSGMTRKEIASNHDVSYQSLMRLFKRYGIPAHRRKLSNVSTEERRERIGAMVAKGFTNAEIAREFGASKSWAAQWKRRLGMTRPHGRELQE